MKVNKRLTIPDQIWNAFLTVDKQINDCFGFG